MNFPVVRIEAVRSQKHCALGLTAFVKAPPQSPLVTNDKYMQPMCQSKDILHIPHFFIISENGFLSKSFIFVLT